MNNSWPSSGSVLFLKPLLNCLGDSSIEPWHGEEGKISDLDPCSTNVFPGLPAKVGVNIQFEMRKGVPEYPEGLSAIRTDAELF